MKYAPRPGLSPVTARAGFPARLSEPGRAAVLASVPSEANTTLVRDLLPGPAGGDPIFGGLEPRPLADGRVLFLTQSDGNLWVTDGTEAGTTRVDAPPANLGGFFGSVFGDGRVLHRAADGLYADASGAHRILDLPPNGIAREATTVGDGRAVFTSDAGGSGAEPWITDGTPGGTMLMADINPQGGSFPGGYLAFTEPPLL